jgi:hypothetical protein
MKKLAGILLALGVVGSPSVAMAADVVTEVYGQRPEAALDLHRS